MFERKSNGFFFFLLVHVALLAIALVHALTAQISGRPVFLENRKLVEKLGLTDLCLFTDARYTRHPSMADLNTPFQDYPMSLEHFPSGSLLPVPPHLKPRQPN